MLVKIDVEGHEAAVLRGAPRTLSNPALLAVVMETNGSGSRYGARDDELIEAMAGHGFVACGYNPFARELLAAPALGGNTVFVRDKQAVAARVRAASRFRAGSSSI